MRSLLSLPLPHLLALSILQISASLAAGTRKNVTVDDTLRGPGTLQIVYSPPGAWSTGQNCTTCEAKVDKTQARDGSWHDVSFISDNPPPSPITASLTFQGIGVYAFCIITRSNSDPNGNWDLSFLIDGEQSGAFTLAPNGDDTYHYNVPVYANDSLAPGTHTFTMVVGHRGGNSSIALLDYIVFTQEDDASPTSSSASSAPPNSSTPSLAPPTTITVSTLSSTQSTHISLSVPASALSSPLTSALASAASSADPSTSPTSNAAEALYEPTVGGVFGAALALAGVVLGAALVW